MGTAAAQSNWNLNNIPTSAIIDAIQFAGSAQTTTNNNISGLTVGSITFNSGAGAFTNSGNSLTLNGDITNSSSNNQVINHALALSAGAHTIATTGANLSIGGAISGTGSLTKIGGNQLSLLVANTFSGSTLVSAGTLDLTNALALQNSNLDTSGSGTVTNSSLLTSLTFGGLSGSTNLSTTISSGFGSVSSITLNPGSNSVYNGVISNGSGATTLTISGTGSQTLTAANTYTGATTIAAGATLFLGNGSIGGSLSTSSAITNNGSLVFDRSNAVTQGTDFSGAALDGVGDLYQFGTASSVLTLNAANTYTGTTIVGSGVLNIQNDTALGTTAGGTTVSSGAALQLQGGITVGTETLSLSGTGVSSDGALRNISGTNAYGGLLSFGSNTRINSDAGTLTLGNTGTIAGATRNLTVGGAGNTNIAGIIGTTTGGLTKDGAGTLTLSGANTYSGNTTVSTGTLTVAASGTFNNSANLSVANGAILDVSAMTGGFGLGQTTAQALNGLGTVTGATTVASNGTIRGDTGTGTGTLNTGNLTVNTVSGTGAKLQAAASDTGINTATASNIQATGNLNLNLNSTPGQILAIELFNGGTPLSTDGSETYTITLAQSTGGVFLNGSVTPLAAGYIFSPTTDFSLNSPDFGINSSYSLKVNPAGTGLELTFTPVPEPATMFAFGAVGLGIAGFVRRKLRKTTLAV